MNDTEDCDLPCGPILYVLVVGFHHKKGCLIEYCFPPMRHTNSSDQREDDDIEGDGILDGGSTTSTTTSKQENIKVPFRLPKVWRTLPSIALPDGAHNYDRDTIYFHLPHPERPLSTIYGISCYRQISSDQLHRKTDDVTRETVQKSVVVLSELPLYGLIAAKCEMITYAYFNEFDFSKVDCLKELYNNLNGLLTKDYLNSSEVFLGLSPRDLIATFQHKILILFKLLLLEKKVLFYKSPVQDLCTIILTLLSLFPGMIEEGGLDYSSTSVVPKPSIGRKFSGDIELLDPLIQEIDAKEKEANNFASKMRRKQSDACNNTPDNNTSVKDDELSMAVDGGADITMLKEEINEIEKQIVNDIVNQDTPDEVVDTEIKSVEKLEVSNNEDDGNGTKKNEDIEDEEKSDELNISIEDIEKVEKLACNENNEDVNSQDIRSTTPPLLKLPLSECGLPLRIFGNGAFCHPYLSITYLDILSDPRVRSCVVGATNFLFRQKKNLFDIIIEVDGGKIEISDPELRKKVALSTEDLRFADFLVKAALEGQGVNKNSTVQNVPNDGSSWEGCDDWLRYQFKIYLLHLLRTSQCEENSKEYASFNSLFLSSWKETYNYRLWSSLSKPGIFEVNPGHPFHGQLSIADMKLKLSQAFSNTERGKKLNQTLGQTSKAVGGALSSAKTAVSSWWSSQWNTSNRTRENNSPPTSLVPSYSLTGLLKSLDNNKNSPTSTEPESESKPKDDVEEI